MANSDTPFGLRPYRYLNGAPWNGQVNIYYHSSGDSTALYKGDVVQVDDTNGADTTGKYPAVMQHVAAQVDNVGVVVGFGNTPQLAADVTNLARRYCPAATAMYLAVVDDPNVIFVAQEDSDTSIMAATSCLASFDIIVGTGSTTTGISGMEIDSSSEGTTGTLRVMRLADWTDASGSNAIGAHAKWEVMLAEHHYRYEAGV